MTRQTACAGAALLAAASGAAAFVAAPGTLSAANAPRAPAAAATQTSSGSLFSVAAPAAVLAVAAAPAVRRQRRAARRAETKEAAPAKEAAGKEIDAKTMADLPPSLQAAAARAAAGTNIRAKKVEREMFDPATMAGVTQPFGYFDPLGFCPTGDEPNFRRLRTSEMKHGRIAMLASVGLVAQHYIRIPTGTFDEVPSGVFAVTDPNGIFGIVVLIWTCLVLEFVVFAQDPSKEIGDFGDPFNVGMMSPEMRNRELNNGRMAMFATIGILVAELATGKDGVEQLGLP